MNNECIFCKIVKNEKKVFKIYEDEKHLAFMDAFPSFKGQVLVIPKKHVSNYLEMQEQEYKELMETARTIAKKMKQVFKPLVVALIIEGLEVPHVHVKLYPIQKGQFLGIPIGKKAEEQELKTLSEKLRIN